MRLDDHLPESGIVLQRNIDLPALDVDDQRIRLEGQPESDAARSGDVAGGDADQPGVGLDHGIEAPYGSLKDSEAIFTPPQTRVSR
jgi:hypothetical protein